jgi:uncharacterized protein YceH (UPF0502 family)
MSVPAVLPLSPLEARVLAVLVEKQRTVPDTYPLSLNALVAGCNQKTSRDPVIEAGEHDIREALEGLRARSLVIESSGGRVMRYEENTRRVLGAPTEVVALLATLMLRGPQTPAELRANCERLHRFSDVSAIEGYLDELARREPQPFVTQLPRQPGSREQRWAHLLCGVPAAVADGGPRASMGVASLDTAGASFRGRTVDADEFDALCERVARLEHELAELRARLGPA